MKKRYLILLALVPILITGILWISGKSLMPARENSPVSNVDENTPKTESITLKLNPQFVDISPNQTQEVYVDIDTPSPLKAADIFLDYDEEDIEILTVTPGEFLPSPIEVSKDLKTTGRLFYAIASLKPQNGTGTLIKLTIRGLKSGQTQITVNDQTTASVVGHDFVNINK
jgi:hypothetical protein